MLRIISHHFTNAQSSIFDEFGEGIDWGDDPEDDFESPWERYIEDNIEPQLDEQISVEPTAPYFEIEREEGLEVDEEIPSVEELLTRSMSDPPNVIKIDYTTKDGRFTSDRVVEPHRTFYAPTTGNNILLTFDRTVNDIRGFIIGNIKPFGEIYKNTFSRKPEIMRERQAPSRLISKRR